ncbi:MAG TPA: heme exporter protein CcmB [Acidimicrobiales bacterium]|nr:heme exporter protein CcmB [Acidimicrobiales bacterium]
MFRDAALVAGKDLRVEWRSRVGAQQVLPFALVVLVIFAFALDANHNLLQTAAAGLYWVAVLFAGVLTVQRSFALEAADGLRDGLRLSGLDPAGIFLGKAAAVAGQLAVLEIFLAGGIAVLYSASLHGVVLLVLSAVLATIGLAAAGTVYGIVAAGLGVRETLLPLLLLPVVAPVLLAAGKVWEITLQSGPGAWGWMRILVIFAVVYLAAGVLAFGPLLEES